MRTHPVNVAYLVSGLAFLGIAGCWALTEAGVVDARAGWILPLVLVVAGGVGLVASLARGLNRTQPASPYVSDVQRRDGSAEDDLGDAPDDLGDEAGDGTDDETGDEEPTRVLGDG